MAMHPDLKPYLSPMAIASYVVVIGSTALRSVYPKSTAIGLFVGCVMIAVYASWLCLGDWRRSTSTSQKRSVLMLLAMLLALAGYGGYLSLSRILG
jgi:hypothetical protein